MNKSITLDSNPCDAPCCRKVINRDGRDLLIQTDWDWPALASVFGWSVVNSQTAERSGDFEWFAECGVFRCKECHSAYYPMELDGGHCQECGGKCDPFTPCEHIGTDGTIECPSCKMPASSFIQAAGEWLDNNDGATAEDPGYFNN